MQIVKIDQDMDAAAISTIKPLLDELANSESDVCFDMSSVGFLDSSGVGAIVYVLKRLRGRSRSVFLVNAKGQPLRLLRQLKLEFLLSAPAGAA
jgi:anti-anti-sigma factor